MNARLLATAFILAALGLRFFVAAPAQTEAATAGEAYRRARDERHDIDRRLDLASRREARRSRAVAMVAGARAATLGPGDPVMDLRRDAVASVKELGVSDVRLAVSAARAPLAASLQVTAVGSLDRAGRLVEDLTRRRGLVLERVRFEPGDTGQVLIDVAGARLQGGS